MRSDTASFYTEGILKYGYFNDGLSGFDVVNPLTPKPWTNYLGNRDLKAFISQNAGGMLWRKDPLTQRITRYHHTIVPPGDRPGFYVYIKDIQNNSIWNPHFAPTCNPLEKFICRHSPGISSFHSEKDKIQASVYYTIPPKHNAFLIKLEISNKRDSNAEIKAASYLEFGLLEPERESWWICLQYQFSMIWDSVLKVARYDYHVFEAPHMPKMLFGIVEEPPDDYELSRDIFIGKTGSLEKPESLLKDCFSNSEMPGGGHLSAVLGKKMLLKKGETKSFTYIFTIGDTWAEAENILLFFRQERNAVDSAFQAVRQFWLERSKNFQVSSSISQINRWINIWNPYNALMCLEHARSNGPERSPCGLQYRDTTQDALAVANLDPEFSKQMMRELFRHQGSDGSGCFSYIPGTNKRQIEPRRSDNTVWQIYTLYNLVAETGTLDFFNEVIPFRDHGEASVYDHVLLGLLHIYNHRGKNGLPLRFYADWNDGLAIFQDPNSESVMLGMQLVYACKLFKEIAMKLSKLNDVKKCEQIIEELTALLNSEKVWDGRWYRRLLLSNGTFVGSDRNRQGKIFINSQTWSVISGVGEFENRGKTAMDSLHQYLDTEHGIRACFPPYAGFPEPEDPPLGSLPGNNENGGIFLHANTWAIMANALLGNRERTLQCFYKILPQNLASSIGEDVFQREPYVVCSNIAAPPSSLAGRANGPWLSGTANWLYIAATQYIFGVRPVIDGLIVKPVLPVAIKTATVKKSFRGCEYTIKIYNNCSDEISLKLDGEHINGCLLPPPTKAEHLIECHC